MRVLALDLSTYTGYAVLDTTKSTYYLHTYGTVSSPSNIDGFGKYPYSYVNMAEYIGTALKGVISDFEPDRIVIEETNKSRARYSQKILEYIHYAVLRYIRELHYADNVVYINTSVWRKKLDVYLSKEDKKNNTKVSVAKRKNQSKKELGLKGKITKKHVAIRVVNERFGLSLIRKDEDIADAICLGAAYIEGAEVCNGH